ncbi:RDD family protein [Anaerorhabdus sp.]|uniref:RDD family protein n=1 Tax=Anaerorhabdus sp. TaxID=1872524 RepID=UPI002FC7B6E7
MNNLLVKRVLATLLDIVIVSLPTLIVAGVGHLLKVVPQFNDFLNNFNFITQISTIYILFFTMYDYFYMRKFHTTIGKNKFQIHIETEQGKRRIPQRRQFTRSLSKSLSLFAIYSIPAVISLLIMTNDYSTSIHDKIVRTGVWENTVG